ncbi:MAG TPA: hypothetical protein VKT74_01550 [Gammaproteobacteria bacterium]|nr:hypothetical protein [Gammaproteobacteria bacterium]
MHASLEQLIGLRDEEPVAMEVQQHVRGCNRCARTLNELVAMREGLAALAEPLPPPGAWNRIVAAAEASGKSARRRWLPAAGVSLVASVAVAVFLINARLLAPTAAVPAAVTTTASSAPADVGQLMAESQYLEHAVLNMNDNADSMAVSAGTASTVAALEDRIALVDYEINNTPARGASDPKLAQLWKQRVDLLQSLAAMRYAQVTSSGI